MPKFFDFALANCDFLIILRYKDSCYIRMEVSYQR